MTEACDRAAKDHETIFRDFIEEIADVEIMLAEIKYYFGARFCLDIKEKKELKLKRLQERLL